MKVFIYLLAIAGMTITASVIYADVPMTADAWIQKGDALYPARASLNPNQQALAFYEKALTADPSRVDSYWKASRAAWWVGTQLSVRDERLAYFKRGIQFGQEAVQRDPQSAEAHFWLAGNYGSYGHARGVLSSLFLIRPIRRELDQVNKLNDRYMAGGAYRILGIMDYKIPAFAGGSKKRALERLQKALAMDPENPVTIFYLADYYASIDDKVTAKKILRQLDSLHPSADFAPELPLMQKQAQELAATL